MNRSLASVLLLAALMGGGLATAAASSGGAAVAASATSIAAGPLAPSFLSQLLGEVAPGLATDAHALDSLLPAGQAPDPAATLGKAFAVRDALAPASTPQDALRAQAALSGVTLAPAASTPAGPLASEIIGSYARLGLVPTLDQIADLHVRVAQLPAADAAALADVLHAVNGALDAQAAQDYAKMMSASIVMLDAADAAKAILAPQTTASAACGTPFEDPLKLVYYGTPCDDVVLDDAARLLQVDPGGNDVYYDNAGGAFPLGLVSIGGAFSAGFTANRSLQEIPDNVTLGPFFPVKTNTSSPAFDSWLANATDPSLNNSLLQTLLNNVDTPAKELQFVQEWIAGFHPYANLDQNRLRKSVPVALAVDYAGTDTYSAGPADLQFQGSTSTGGIGILRDDGGDDSYSCYNQCQAFSTLGIGVLADLGGSDTYVAREAAQGSGQGGFLMDFAGDDTYTSTGGIGTQGSMAQLLIPSTLPSFLMDKNGNDAYSASGAFAQGAGAYLVDLSGDDSYTAAGDSQGEGIADSIGMLLDGNGNDVYSAGESAQGYSRSGVGILADLSGDDSYTSSFGIAQGASTSLLGILYDQSGDDHYTAVQGQGYTSFGAGVLADSSGNDVYTLTGSGQGSTTALEGSLAVLVDGDGDDTYVAGDNSQGSGASGAGLLLDGYGSDSYTAGANSQGSSTGSGLGALIDGTQDEARTTLVTDARPGSLSGGIEVSTPPSGPATVDHYTAGNYSQGSSGPQGGVGLLLDRQDQSSGSASPVSTFTAGHHSQGSASVGGLGILDNADGRDKYTAGAFSQGASDGGLGLLVDESGGDEYAPADPATSHGYGVSSVVGANPGVGVLLDDGGSDDHHGDLGDNECKAKGNLGLAVDTEGASLPANCPTAIVQGVNDTLTAAVNEVVGAVSAIIFGAPVTPPSGTIYFYDGMEDSTASAGLWTTDSSSNLPPESLVGCLVGSPVDLTTWRIRSASTDPQAGPGAHTGNQYWYVGLPANAPVEGYSSCSTATLTSAAISLSGATAPELRAWIAGSSETNFDYLKVFVKDTTAGTTTQVASYTGEAVDGGGSLLPAYGELVVDLSGHVGNTVQLVFQFTSDASAEPGMGYNVDDVLVKEA